MRSPDLSPTLRVTALGLGIIVTGGAVAFAKDTEAIPVSQAALGALNNGGKKIEQALSQLPDYDYGLLDIRNLQDQSPPENLDGQTAEAESSDGFNPPEITRFSLTYQGDIGLGQHVWTCELRAEDLDGDLVRIECCGPSGCGFIEDTTPRKSMEHNFTLPSRTGCIDVTARAGDQTGHEATRSTSQCGVLPELTSTPSATPDPTPLPTRSLPGYKPPIVPPQTPVLPDVK